MRPSNPRRDAFEILRRVDEGGAFASVLIERRAAGLADPRDAALLNATVLGVLRRRAALDHVIARVASRESASIDPPVLTALRLGAHALLFLDRVPDFAAVDTAVTLVKATGHAKAAGFVNGVLRAIARTGAALLPPEPAEGDVEALALSTSHPVWWAGRVVARMGWERGSALLRAHNEPAATVLAPWPAAGTRDDLVIRLAREGVDVAPCRFATQALRVVSGVPQSTRTFLEGAFWIQDEAAQLACAMFGATVGPRVADLCAAPGGKTLGLAARLVSGGSIVAGDRHTKRLARLRANLRRLDVREVHPVTLDAVRASSTLAARFDDVMVDAPCSGTGTLRRHPEIRWRLREGDLPTLATRQLKILEGVAPVVAPGGRLIYTVCSIEPEEGEQVVERFLEEHREFEREDPGASFPLTARACLGPDHALRTHPLQDGMDGFFAARLRRTL